MTRPAVFSRSVLLLVSVCACVDERADVDAVGAGGPDGDATGGGDGWVADDGSDPATKAEPDGKQVLLDPGAHDDAELVKTLPVGHSSSGADRRVVMRLGPGQIPALQPGDRLIVPAEVQVTTRCDVGQSAPGCDYNPTVAAQLILTGSADDSDPGGVGSQALSAVQTISCTRAEHHCLLTFQRDDTNVALVDAFDLPCVAADNCHVNLVMWAWHPDARADGVDRVLVGENEGDYLVNGVVGGDKGRLMVVRERDLVAADRLRSETTGGGDKSIPTNTEPVLLYSHKLKPGDLKAGEQYLIEGKAVVAVSGRARFSTQLFLTKDPGAKQPAGALAQIVPGSINEHNGSNCTTGTSPCTARKVAVFRVTDTLSGPVYVNWIAKSAVPGGGTANVTVRRNDGFLRATRYRAELAD